MVLLLFVAGIAQAAPGAGTTDYKERKAEAERLFAAGTYQKAHDVYAAIATKGLPAVERRWVAFRVADTEWRSASSSSNRDYSRLNAAQQSLAAMVEKVEREEDRDRVWAEIQESLGDFYWIRNDSRNWYQGWQFYTAALDWWAGANVEVETARARYLGIVWRIARPPDADSNYYYGYYGNTLPQDVLQNVLEIAKTPDDKARAHFLMAMTLRSQGGGWEQISRVPEEFEAALARTGDGVRSEWYDDALFNYAQHLESSGRARQLENGSWTREPDYVGALALYQRFLREYKKGESRWWDQAKSQSENIVAPVLSAGVSNVFLPESEIQYSLSWRNVGSIDLVLYAVDLSKSVAFRKDQSSSEWLASIDVAGAKKVTSWSKDTKDKGEHKPGSSQETLPAMPRGAYLLEASARGPDGKVQRARDLVLVTQAALVVKSSPKKVLLYVADATTGAPRPKAHTVLWQRNYKNGVYTWKTRSLVADANGIAVYDRRDAAGDGDTNELYAAASADDDQCFSPAWAPSRSSEHESWKIYAFTDRPAYRPGDKASWKFIARTYDGETYSTPASKPVEWEIYDPQGAKIHEGKATLNAFGSAWGEISLTDKMPLGEYQIRFYTAGKSSGIGEATLLRLEEYKLPEFSVSVKTPEEGGRRKTFRVGEKVTAEVQVDYFFGGAVSNADVQLLVTQSPYSSYWTPPHAYPWFYEDMMPVRPYWYGNDGSVIKQERLKTDANGRVQITFDTPRGANQDFEYRVEARVTDSSRREVSGSGSVRVTRQKFYAWLTPQHSIFRPKEKVTLDVKTLDANEEPYPAEGAVTITRDYWWEVWLDPKGREIKGEELAKIYRDKPGFTGVGYTLKFRGYQHDEIEKRTATTDAKGEAEIAFTPEREGYYRIEWSTPEKGRNPVVASTNVWVASEASTELGYRHGGLEILVDRDTILPGATVPVMINVPQADRWVLFSVGGDDLYRYELVHVTGTVKLLEVKLEDAWVPNVFLEGQMVRDQQLFTDVKQVVIPPVKHFLTVTVEPDRKEYQARDEGTWTVTTRDDTGKAVAAEVAVGVVDESVYSIQSEIAGDPRQFYFGTKRRQNVQTATTFGQKSYVKLVPGAAGVRAGGTIDEAEGVTETADAQGGERDDLAKETPGGGAMGFGSVAAASPKAANHAGPADALKAVGSKRGKEESKKDSNDDAPAKKPPTGSPDPGEPAVVVRTDFRATAFWKNDVVTDADGRAKFTLKYPDTLTAWRATARGVSRVAQFGMTTGAARTRMPLLVRLQGPRFYVVGDVTLVSGVINNNTDHAISATAELVADGLTVKAMLIDGKPASPGTSVSVPPGNEARVDWRVVVERAGEATLKVVAKGGGFADAMEKKFPVYEHGIDKLVAKAGKMRGDGVTVKLDLPKERREGSTELSVSVAPSLAVTMLDALPYLIDYPYGCTEQTLSRFVPAAIVRKTLGDLGLDPKKAMNRAFGGIEPEFADKTHPKGKKDLKDLDAMTGEGLKRLYDFQHSDGGWGWWKDGSSDRYMSAYVLWGLSVARDGGVEVRGDVLSRAADYLAKELVSEEGNADRQAWILNALSIYWAPSKRAAPGKFEKKAFDHLWEGHTRMNAYTRALFALSAHRYGYADKAQTLVANLENGVVRDTKPDTSVVMEGAQSTDASVMGTVHWGQDTGWWRWSDSGIETTSFALMAILTVDPKSALVEPTVNWLVKNRRGAQWNNTKDTSITVLALTQYLKVSGEIGSPMEFALTVNGKEIARKKLSKDDALGAPSRFVVEGRFVRDANEIKLQRLSGTGPLYFSAEARFFSLEEPITPAGHEIFVRRKYSKRVGRKTLLKGYVYDTVPLEDNGTVNSGDRIEVVVTVETKNDYEYLLFEDLKPAGFEAVEVKSGEPLYAKQVVQASYERNYGKLGEDGATRTHGLGASTDEIDYTGQSESIYQELRDRKVALFATHLKQGVWEIRYELRAEVPGKFHALPLMGHAMYVPEIRANSSEVRVEVLDRE